MFAAALTAGGNVMSNDLINTSSQNEIVISEEVTNGKEQVNTLTTKEIVEDYFQDIPVMIDVAYCESRFRQFDANGNVLRGDYNALDVGVMQINEKYHADTAAKLGLNLHTTEGNMAYARYLYETQGTRPWNYSSHCWGKTREVALR